MASLLAVDVMNLVVSRAHSSSCTKPPQGQVLEVLELCVQCTEGLCQTSSDCQACCHCHRGLPPPTVQTNGAVRPIVRKKAALCLLRLLRKAGPDSDMLAPDAWSVKLVSGSHVQSGLQQAQPARQAAAAVLAACVPGQNLLLASQAQHEACQ